MKKIKTFYWVTFSVFTILTILCTLLSPKENMASIFLSGVAILIAILALGLSDQKKLRFNGSVHFYSYLLDTNTPTQNSNYRVSMKVFNNSEEPIYDIVYRLRLPNRITSRLEEKNNSVREYRHGASVIFIDDSYGFLDVKGEEGFIPFDFKMKLGNWNKGNIYVTISGSNISPTTFKITHEQKEVLINSNQDNYIDAKEITS